jgi:hypothetical protein
MNDEGNVLEISEEDSYDSGDTIEEPKKQKDRMFNFSSGGLRFLVYGPSGSGKSFFSAKKMFHSEYLLGNHFSKIIMISPTYDGDDSWLAARLIDNNIFQEVSTDLLEEVYEYLIEYHEKYPEKHTCIIMDDCIKELTDIGKKKKNNIFNEIIANSRKFNISLYIVIQSIRVMNTIFRENIDYFIGFRPKNQKAKNTLYEEFGSMSRKKWDELIDKIFPPQTKYNNLMIELDSYTMYKNLREIEIINKN